MTDKFQSDVSTFSVWLKINCTIYYIYLHEIYNAQEFKY